MTQILFEIEKHPSPLPDEQRERILADPGFGQFFTDHMVTIQWTGDKGWHDATISSYKPLKINPSSSVLHYAQEIFEGLKAYRAKDGRVLLFRPDANAHRFTVSAKRLAMPELPTGIFLDALNLFLKIEHKWVPNTPNSSLYIRPFMFGNDTTLKVSPAQEYLFCVIASPVGSYFKGKGESISVWIETDYSRAGPGGTGTVKCGGNYAASLLAQRQAIKDECSQVLFLDSIERKWIEELGGMNIFFIMEDDIIITPALTGTILPGITRDSLIKLAQQMGLRVEETSYSFESLKKDAENGQLREVFACGTGAAITPIGRFKYKDGEIVIKNREIGKITEQLRTQLVNLQTGNTQDKNGWVHPVQIS